MIETLQIKKKFCTKPHLAMPQKGCKVYEVLEKNILSTDA
jgi:hypothetical protein